MEKNTKTRIMAAVIATMVGATSLTGCKSESSNEIPKPSISSRYNDFDDYTKLRIVNGEAIQSYKGENISIAINKETNEINEYVYNHGFFIYEVYELRTGDMILYGDSIATTYGKEYYENMINSSNIVDFVNIGDYVEGEICKDWYTLEEIEELEPKILESVLKIREAEKTLQKSK